MQLGDGGRKGAIREMVASVAPCKRVLPVADCLPTKAFAETVVIRPHGFFELHFIRAWHVQAAKAVIHFGPFRSGHPPTEIATRVEWDGRMCGAGCAASGLRRRGLGIGYVALFGMVRKNCVRFALKGASTWLS
jgi:hypothetical protein